MALAESGVFTNLYSVLGSADTAKLEVSRCFAHWSETSMIIVSGWPPMRLENYAFRPMISGFHLQPLQEAHASDAATPSMTPLTWPEPWRVNLTSCVNHWLPTN